jgi:dual specificity phosphatase 12
MFACKFRTTDIMWLKEMETSQMSESLIQQKPGPEANQNPVGNDVNPGKETDELPGSEVNEEPLETCQDTVVETEIIPEKKADPEAGLEVNQKPTETCQEKSAESFLKEKSAESDVNPEKRTPDPGVIYRCKKCRRMLATQEFVVTHEVGAGGKSFNRGKRSDDDDKQTECPCIFVEPMKWMQTVEEGYVANKLFCMGCKARLGQFNWAGMQCSCGAWVIPAFQLTKSKIDECSM